MDLTKQEDVVAFMRTSETDAEWCANVAKVREANNHDYPKFWYKAMLASGVADEILSRWRNGTKIRLESY